MMNSSFYFALSLPIGLLLDWCLGEPRRYHPLIGFGRYAEALARWAYAPTRWRGVLVVLAALLPPVLLAVLLSRLPDYLGFLFSLWALYFSLGHKSLHAHVRPIITALEAGDEPRARQLVARIVSRDAAHLEIVPASCETILENGNDAVFGALFWFMCAGAPGVILYRLSNTLDAMWGYKNEHYLAFGWAAARLDDVLNYIPARLTACTYALLGQTRVAFACWRAQAPVWESPNAGPVMASGAGALGVRLGGAAYYHGVLLERPTLGVGDTPCAADMTRALQLVRYGVFLWGALFILGNGLWLCLNMVAA